MHTFIVLPPHRRQPTPSDALHDKQKAPHHITQMCLWGGVRHSITEGSAPSLQLGDDTRCDHQRAFH